MAFWLSYVGALKTIFTSPFSHTNILWQLTPVLILWIILEVYFDTHKHESLGWNTALGNAISLSWIVLGSIQTIFADKKASIYSGITYFTWTTFFILLILLVYAFFIGYISFSHSFSSKTTYFLAYPTIVYFLALTGILFGYGIIMPNKWTFLALGSIWIAIGLLKLIFWWLLPENSDDVSDNDSSAPISSASINNEKNDFSDNKSTSSDKSLDSSFNDFKF